MTSIEELKKLFAENGLVLDDDLAQVMFAKMTSIKNGDELTPEELEFVAGGKVNWKRVLYSAATLVVAGAATGNPAVFGLGCAAAVCVIQHGANEDLKSQGYKGR